MPIFFSEYGNQNHQPRLFQETKALYSPRMSQVFSGGRVYEFWQGSNGYGLVEMFEREQASRDPRFVAYHLALTRADDQTKVFEKRDNGQGLLLIFHDFVNYKENLAATRAAESGWDPNFMYHGGMERRSVDIDPKELALGA